VRAGGYPTFRKFVFMLCDAFEETKSGTGPFFLSMFVHVEVAVPRWAARLFVCHSGPLERGVLKAFRRQ
jgi:hypothetical protein